jgi:hypothetical protein
MKSLIDYGLERDGWIIIQSEICSVAETLGNIKNGFEIKNRLHELSASYYNQWRFVLDSYKKLFVIFTELNEKNIELNDDDELSEFDFFLLKIEPEIKNYSYLFIISLKSLLDILVCIVDLIQNREIKKEHNLPDFFNFYGSNASKNIKYNIPKLKEYLDIVRKQKSWITEVKSFRDRILHRGYILKSDIGFSRVENLIIKTYIDVNSNAEIIRIDIGDILTNFLNDIKKIEGEISKILLLNMDDLKKVGLTHRSKFRFTELINEYSSEQIKITKTIL